ncbi:N-6 DNA methylase [Paraglaciecola chathamensis]|uniref:site-specific DNA-methyltransferase (adenine-specific) n=1 Tax=Paraglaciecola chathamensis TaxID=368405 RepID=A0ABS0WAQ1_9ALTE|nr:class I SAM-dependent DNA methyltransferase [Paraglaciecola chathamensis]MBJ2135539.1 N-6 DNA methylase [Paraglaciecola chathamensis]
MSQNSTNLSNFVWQIANDLWGDFKHTDFARIILPLLLLRRIECVLDDTKESVLKVYNQEKDSGVDMELFLPTYSKYPFFNTSNYNLETIGATETLANLENYISHFSQNIRTIFEEFGFANTIVELDRAKLLFRITKSFSTLPLGKEDISDRDISNAYEEIIRRFAASINEKAGEFMSPSDITALATHAVIAPDEEIFSESGVIRTVYDGACGIGGFLSDAISLITELSPVNSPVTVIPYGQELDPRTHAMALTSMLIRDYDEKNIKQGSTLSDDKLPNEHFHYQLYNPPFGKKWEKDQAFVIKEHKNLGYAGRFGPGLPRVSDGSMLFLLHAVSKMESPEKGGGRIGIVLSGSPLFTGDAGSGESEIRRWLMEKDYVEAIFALPTDMFFNTGIGTYIWILTNKKSEERKGKVQLINLANTWTHMRKNEGTKRRFISKEQIDNVMRDYEAFEEKDNIKIFDNAAFAYRKIHVKRPLRAKLVVSAGKISTLEEVNAFAKLSPAQQTAWSDFFTHSIGEHAYDWIQDNGKLNNNKDGFSKVGKPLLTAFTNHFMERDEAMEPVLDSKGDVVVDTTLNDTESVPYNESISEYFGREVLPHVSDAFIDHSVRDAKDGEVGIVGYEINFNRYFYEYKGHRQLKDIDAELLACENRIRVMLEEVAE